MKRLLKSVGIIVAAFIMYEAAFWARLDYPDNGLIYNALTFCGHFILSIPLNRYFLLKERVR